MIAPTEDAPRAATPMRLTEKYRPRTLDDVLGQDEVVWGLREFLREPYSTALLFHGPTGVGKTTAARALARHLGCDPDDLMSDFEEIESGGQRADTVREVVERLHRGIRSFTNPGGWKVLLVEEADKMSRDVEIIWLSALEGLSARPRTLLIFTTNDPEKLAERLVDRCEPCGFVADPATAMADARRLVERIWRAETGTMDDAPDVRRLGVIGSDGLVSFRRVVQALEPRLRAYRARRDGRAAPTPASPADDVAGPDDAMPPTIPLAEAARRLPAAPRPRRDTPAAGTAPAPEGRPRTPVPEPEVDLETQLIWAGGEVLELESEKRALDRALKDAAPGERARLIHEWNQVEDKLAEVGLRCAEIEDRIAARDAAARGVSRSKGKPKARRQP